jgi:hypothetical protein
MAVHRPIARHPGELRGETEMLTQMTMFFDDRALDAVGRFRPLASLLDDAPHADLP